MRKVYADNAATTALHPQVLEQMMPYLTTVYGNPSSLYRVGAVAKEAIEDARAKIATLIGANNGVLNCVPNDEVINCTKYWTTQNKCKTCTAGLLVSHDNKCRVCVDGEEATDSECILNGCRSSPAEVSESLRQA